MLRHPLAAVRHARLLSEALLSMVVIEWIVTTKGLATGTRAIHAVARLSRRHRPSAPSQLAPIQRAILRASRLMPGQHQCLSQSLTALFMCQRRRLPVSFHLGARLGDASVPVAKRLIAHAWVEYRGQDLFGGSPQAFAAFPSLSSARP